MRSNPFDTTSGNRRLANPKKQKVVDGRWPPAVVYRLLRRRRLSGSAPARGNLAGAMPPRSRAPRGLAACRFNSKGLLPPTWHCLPISSELESGNSCAQRYPWVEWGVLFRDDKEGQPRFASAKWVDDLVAVNRTSPMQVCACACMRAHAPARAIFALPVSRAAQSVRTISYQSVCIV
jgi:hypothetical protein